MKLSRMSFILEYAKFRVETGIEKQLVVRSPEIMGFEIRYTASSKSTAMTWWKKFARDNNIRKNHWMWADVILDQAKEEARISKEFKDEI